MIQGTLPAGVDWGDEALGEGAAGVRASCCRRQHSCEHSLTDSSVTVPTTLLHSMCADQPLLPATDDQH